MDEVWTIVKGFEGKTLFTLSRHRPFVLVSVLDDRIVYSPVNGSGAPRWSWRKDIEHLVALRQRLGFLTPSRVAEEFPTEYNSSYMAAIVDEIVNQS